MLKYAYCILVNVGVDYSGEPIERSIARLAKFGYDGVEFVGEPSKVQTREIRQLLKKYQIKASSVVQIFTDERHPISAKETIRRNAVEYVKDCINMANEIEAPVVTTSCSACMKVSPEAPFEKERSLAIEFLRETGEYAGKLGIKLAVEPWNRYETYFINRLEQALDLINAVGLKNVGVMGDLFHMNIEESSLAGALTKVGSKLVHLHIADSNRQAPGRGHTDFQSVASALKQIGYSRYLTMEFLPPSADPYAALKGARTREFYDLYTKESIEYMKRIWQ